MRTKCLIIDDEPLAINVIKNYLDDLKIQFKENPLLVRGLDYYNDLVFEWKSNSIGSQDTICGGGRYDSLSKIIGGRETSAIGLSIGLERLCLLIEDSIIKKVLRDGDFVMMVLIFISLTGLKKYGF